MMTNSKSIPRVLQVFTVLNRGGAESMIMNYYRHIDRNKVQFDFLVHRPERGAFEDEIESMGGNVYRMPPINPLFPHKYNKKLDEFLKSHNYKIIHSHINTFSSFPLRIAKENSILCRVAHAHTTTLPISFELFRKRPKGTSKIIFKEIQKTKAKKHATHLMACGKEAGSWLFGEKDFDVLPNSIDAAQYTYNKQKSLSIKKDFNLENSIILGHVGSFSHVKNHSFILDVFREVKKRRKDSKLVLIGDGKLRNEIESKAKLLEQYNDISFLGIRDDVQNLLQMIDVFLFPSYYEGLPVTLVEAQAAGLKIFASDSITDEVAFTNDIKFLSLDKTPEYWADKILKSVPYERKDNSETIKKCGYDIVESAKRLEEFYLKQHKD